MRYLILLLALSGCGCVRKWKMPDGAICGQRAMNYVYFYDCNTGKEYAPLMWEEIKECK